eukprot:evm.model.scf_1585.2 EVM.evm.TU.scf_1585.2   scf_1585:32130-32933(+)
MPTGVPQFERTGPGGLRRGKRTARNGFFLGPIGSRAELEDLKRRVFQFRTPQGAAKLNIALVGGASAGKSSFVSTVQSIATGCISRCAPCGVGTNSVTTRFRMYDIGKRGAEAAFRLCDTVGWSRNDWAREGLDSLTMGYVPNGSDMSKGIRGTEHMGSMSSDLPLADRMHCIVFVVPYESVENKACVQHLKALKAE